MKVDWNSIDWIGEKWDIGEAGLLATMDRKRSRADFIPIFQALRMFLNLWSANFTIVRVRHSHLQSSEVSQVWSVTHPCLSYGPALSDRHLDQSQHQLEVAED